MIIMCANSHRLDQGVLRRIDDLQRGSVTFRLKCLTIPGQPFSYSLQEGCS